MRTKSGRLLRWLAGIFVAATAVVVIGPLVANAASTGLKINVLSSRADLVSGGEALVAIEGANAPTAQVKLGNHDMTSSFAVRANGQFEGLVTGLQLGPNVLTAQPASGPKSRITITDHPIGGPVFAGAQTQPWFCQNQANGLGAPIDAQCDTPPVITYQYKNAITGQFESYDPANPPPSAEIAQTTTDAGVTVPYIARIETGVIDRGIYQLKVLADPSKAVSPFDSTAQPAWNHKLYWTFYGDCNPDHVQGPLSGNLVQTASAPYGDAVALGFISAESSNTNLGTDCNSVVAAETVMMVKEHVINTYGPIKFTMSEGCSGGAMIQNWITSDYPGLLNGIQPSCSFPDVWEPLQGAEDCHLLDTVFASAPTEWTDAQQRAVTGFLSTSTCHGYFDTPGTGNTPENAGYARTLLDPTNGAGCVGGVLSGTSPTTGLPAEPPWVYNPTTNPSGTRCTLQDYMSSIFGFRASDGFANRPFDNVGVQYGLNALETGQISPQQFVDLNAQVGGLNIDWNPTTARSTADPAALNVAYRAGLVTNLHEQQSVPVIDLRANDNADIHLNFYSYVERARLDASNGGHGNQIIWTVAGAPPGMQSIQLMDSWLERIYADHRAVALSVKVQQDKPAAAVDACWIDGQEVTDASTCQAAFPYYSDPRIAAGGPSTDNVLKCQLKPLDHGAYNVTFTPAQWATLQNAFPGGVCDYSKPPVGSQPSIPWITFAQGPGGTPSATAPLTTTDLTSLTSPLP